ncbi:MAG: hypothetical protein GY750_06530 [Lentisphaerae bacterium]|nr:hypothetical protein [Lentisphaerota bacterium]MCP4101065.1 hypothetical protein [Lentisphaerota bacterium]
MGRNSKYYKHSGSVGLWGPACIVLVGLIGTSVLGVAYGFAIHWIPSIYLSFFIVLGYAIGVGAVVAFAGYLGKVRNMPLLFTSGILIGLFAIYIGWVSWIFANPIADFIIYRPDQVWSVIKSISIHGAWSIWGWTPKGFVLYAIWGLEALLILSGTLLIPWTIIGFMPFCEFCKKWIRNTVSLKSLQYIDDPEKLKSNLEDGDFSKLNELKQADESVSHTRAELVFCPTCKKEFFLTIISVEIKEEDNGKTDEQEEDIVRNLIVSKETFEKMKALC